METNLIKIFIDAFVKIFGILFDPLFAFFTKNKAKETKETHRPTSKNYINDLDYDRPSTPITTNKKNIQTKRNVNGFNKEMPTSIHQKTQRKLDSNKSNEESVQSQIEFLSELKRNSPNGDTITPYWVDLNNKG